MPQLPKPLERVINEFSRLPGVGQKTAQRLAFYLLKRDQIDIQSFSSALLGLKDGVLFCSRCHNMAETDPCRTCSDSSRDQQLICVVEEPLDAVAVDRGGSFRGIFHVLGGVLSPLEGVGPDQLKVQQLFDRIGSEGTREIILATNPSLEGETTANYLAKQLRAKFPELTVTRIARGLPMGGDLEYADDVTLSRAMEGRREA